MLKLAISILGMSLLFSCGKKAEDNPEPTAVVERPSNQRSIIDEKDKQELYTALTSKDSLMVEYALKRNEHLNYHFVDGETPLTKAIKHTSENIIKLLLAHEVNVNMTNNLGQTPLTLSIRARNRIIFDSLLQLGADVNQKDEHGMSPLANAMFFYTETQSIALVRLGADFKAKDISGLSMEELASMHGFTKLEKLIQSAKAHTSISKINLIKAIKDSDITLLRYLITQFPKYVDIINEHNLLIEVLKNDNDVVRPTMLDYFIEVGAIAHNTNGVTPLLYAIENDLFDEMNKLISKGAQIDYQNELGLDALSLAAIELKYKFTEQIFNIIKINISNASPSEAQDLQEVLDARTDDICRKLPKKQEVRNMPTGSFRQWYQVRDLLNCN